MPLLKPNIYFSIDFLNFLVEIASILFPERTFLKDVVFKIHNIKMITTSSRIEWL